MDDELAARVLQTLSRAWQDQDPDVRVMLSRRADGKLDLTVVSRLFEAGGSEERERILWSAIRSLDPRDTIQMTYSLLLTPSEAAALAADPLGPVEPADGRKDVD
jgi:hypothetical protein